MKTTILLALTLAACSGTDTTSGLFRPVSEAGAGEGGNGSESGGGSSDSRSNDPPGEGGSTQSDAGPSDPCIVAGDSYALTFETADGGCALQFPTQYLTVNKDDSITVGKTTGCTKEERTVCSIASTGCSYSTEIVTYTATTDATFGNGGASVSGTLTLTSGTQVCAFTFSGTLIP